MTDSISTTSIIVPYVNELDGLSSDTLATTLDDRGVRRTIEYLTDDTYPYRPLTTFSIAHSDRYLYIDFFVRCNFLRAVNYDTNSPVYEDSAVAAILRPGPNDSPCYSFAFNCIGTVAGEINRPGHDPEPIDPDKLAQIQRIASCGSRPFQELEGLFSWNILVAIPMELLGINSTDWPKEIHGNFFKCATGTSQPHFLSWLPVHGKFPEISAPDTLGPIVLE